MPDEPIIKVRGCSSERLDELLSLVTARLPDSVAVTIVVTPVCVEDVRAFTSYITNGAPPDGIARILRNVAGDIEAMNR